jgi:betaine-aldehyde dehydrogenase
MKVDHSMEIMHGECFGPLAPVARVKDLDEAIRYANDSELGLGANIYTNELSESARRELGSEGLEQFRRSKMVMIAPDAEADPEWFPYPDADAFPR